jgi:hypothetical protein
METAASTAAMASHTRGRAMGTRSVDIGGVLSVSKTSDAEQCPNVGTTVSVEHDPVTI